MTAGSVCDGRCRAASLSLVSAIPRDLSEALAKTDLPENEARAWQGDFEAARKSLKAPADRWR